MILSKTLILFHIHDYIMVSKANKKQAFLLVNNIYDIKH